VEYETVMVDGFLLYVSLERDDDELAAEVTVS
jgi:hypothetical protein